MTAALVTEFVMTFFFLMIIRGAGAAGVVYRRVSGDRSLAAGIEGPANTSQLAKSR